jgi:threonine dehydrogenase-like Zn-dependent dehydrogenase
VVLKVTTTCICGSDLHMYVGFMPGMKSGDVVGHEFMGVVEDVGPEVKNLKKGKISSKQSKLPSCEDCCCKL